MGPEDTSPALRGEGFSQQPGITWGNTRSTKWEGGGVVSLPPHSSQPPALHDCVRTRWRRNVFGFTVALDQGGWKDGF